MELKPCPFCGSAGKMFKAEWLTPDMRYTTYQFGCGNEDCPCSANRFSTACTEEKAVEAWNTRAERTCAYEFVPNIGGGHLNACGLRCTSCGREQMNLDAPNYCPNCGAKVVE